MRNLLSKPESTPPMTPTSLTGWITDVRGRARFVPTDAFMTACRDPRVVVINQNGYFFVPNLKAGKRYEFVVRNGDQRKRWIFTPKAGHNEIVIALPTKPAKLDRPKRPRQPKEARGTAVGTRPLAPRKAGARLRLLALQAGG